MKTNIENSQGAGRGTDCLPTHTIRTFLTEGAPLVMALLARIVSRNQRASLVGSATQGRKALWNAATP